MLQKHFCWKPPAQALALNNNYDMRKQKSTVWFYADEKYLYTSNSFFCVDLFIISSQKELYWKDQQARIPDSIVTAQ